MSKMNIEWVSVNGITPYTRNAKIHSKSQIEKIAKSITNNIQFKLANFLGEE